MLFYVKEILNNSQDNCNHLKVLRDGKCNNWSLRLDMCFYLLIGNGFKKCIKDMPTKVNNKVNSECWPLKVQKTPHI